MANPRRHQHVTHTVCPSKSLTLKGLGGPARRPPATAGEVACKVPVPPYRQQGNGARDSWINARKYGVDQACEYWRDVLGKPEVRGKYGTMRQQPKRPNVAVITPPTPHQISRLPCIPRAKRGAVMHALNERADEMERSFLMSADIVDLKRHGLYEYALNVKNRHEPHSSR